MNALAEAWLIVGDRQVERDVRSITIARKAFRQCDALRIVAPDAYDPTGYDLQGEWVNQYGKGYWLTICTFPGSQPQWR